MRPTYCQLLFVDLTGSNIYSVRYLFYFGYGVVDHCG